MTINHLFNPAAFLRIITIFISASVLSTAVPFASAADLNLGSGDTLRVEPVAANIFRIRLSADGKFEPSLMERYGIVQTNWPTCEFKSSSDGDNLTFRTSEASLVVRKSDGRIQLLDAKGKVVCQQILPLTSRPDAGEYQKRQAALAEFFKGEKRKEGQIQVIGAPDEEKEALPETMHDFNLPAATKSFGTAFDLKDGERFYGLGTASSKRIQLRGHAYRLWAQYSGNFGFKPSEAKWEQGEGPIPLLISTGGWGIFVNTTWVHYYDIDRYEPNKAFFWGPGGQLDFYLLVGDTLPKLIERYTEITGKPRLLPLFGYGLSYVANITQDASQILDDGLRFRDREIPCDIIGLEPQWMKQYYDSSHNKTWNQDRFFIPSWLSPEMKRETFIGGLERMGFKLSLWLNCKDDLTMEEERQVAIREGRGNEFPASPDAWFNHLKRFVRQGARAFKVDPNELIEEHPKLKYFNQRSDLENHNLTQVLLHKQMCEGFEQFTGKRAMVHYCGAYAGVQHWGATTTGDNGGGPKAVLWILNSALSGHMNTSCDMMEFDGGMHVAFLLPWTQLNNYRAAYQPWFFGKAGEAKFRDYANLRYRLLPYLYSTAWEGHLTGMPIARPMPLVFPSDKQVEDSTHEYMLGDALLVTAFTDKVYLPAGRWIDYWTGKQYEGPQEMPCTYPANRDGGLFIRAGAIIPYGPQIGYVGEKPAETITLHVYPDKVSDFTLYEDDGDSLEYLNGAVAQTKIHCEQTGAVTSLTIEPRKGTYRDMPVRRNYEIWIHRSQPRSLAVSGGDNNGKDLGYSQESAAVRVNISEDPGCLAPIALKCE